MEKRVSEMTYWKYEMVVQEEMIGQVEYNYLNKCIIIEDKVLDLFSVPNYLRILKI